MARKNQAVQFTTVAKVLLISLFLGGSGVGYVLQKSQIRSLRAERDKQWDEIELLENHVRRLDAELIRATSKDEILRSLDHFQLDLRSAEWGSVVTVQEPRITRRRQTIHIVGNK